MAKIQLIIFDLDGTLVNSVADITESLNFVLTTFGEKNLTANVVQAMIGDGVQKLIHSAWSNSNVDPDLLNKAHELFMNRYTDNCTVKTHIYPDVIQTLIYFDKIKKVILSNKPHPLTLKVVKETRLEPHFDLVLGANKAWYKPKPSKEGIDFVLNKLSINPKNTIIVGDSTHDICAGKNAGIHTCAVTYGYRNKLTLETAKPEYSIDRLHDLIPILR